MLRNFAQMPDLKNRLHQISWGYDNPDFELVAAAYNLATETVRNPEELPAAVERMWASPTTPFLLNVIIPSEGYCAPKVE
jgi:thiamine pyrophosphate-dependent acetolactate synthase large subunit-like protein